jgi:ATPase subunit of ABC transporter with duplicated ATPase domains
MSNITVSDLAYSLNGGRRLFASLSFKVSPGDSAAIIGRNGVGKSTLLRILNGELKPESGSFQLGGSVAYMSQNAGDDPTETVREILTKLAPIPLAETGQRLIDAERRLSDGDGYAGMEVAAETSTWSELGGYQLEAQWDSAVHEAMGVGMSEVAERNGAALSGGERKRIILGAALRGTAPILLLDEPDNYLDMLTKRWLEEQLLATPKTVLLISHDRALLSKAPNKIITLEQNGAWVHPGSFVDYMAARRKRQESLGDELMRWKEEERRLYRHYRTMKQRAAQNDKNAPKANAAETRWRRFARSGPPSPPVPEQRITPRLIGGDSGRRVLRLKSLGLSGLISPFDFEVSFGDRIGLVGPNGTGKSHLLRTLASLEDPSEGGFTLGSRVRSGYFSQGGERVDLVGEKVADAVTKYTRKRQGTMSRLARYGLQGAADQSFESLSGGERARLEILILEVQGSNLLLLDEPTDHLDLESSMALETALASLTGTVLAVSHDRAFLQSMNRFLIFMVDGTAFETEDYDAALTLITGLRSPINAPQIRPLATSPGEFHAGQGTASGRR